MKVEIEVDERNNCKIFKLNGVNFGHGISEYNIVHSATEKPYMILHTIPVFVESIIKELDEINVEYITEKWIIEDYITIKFGIDEVSIKRKERLR